MTKDELDSLIANGGINGYLRSQFIIDDYEFYYLVKKGVQIKDETDFPMGFTEYGVWVYKPLIDGYIRVHLHSAFASFLLSMTKHFLVAFITVIPKQVFVALGKWGYDHDRMQFDRCAAIHRKSYEEPPVETMPVEAAYMNCFYNIRQWCSNFADEMEVKHTIHHWYPFGIAHIFLIPFFKWTMFKARVAYGFQKLKKG